MRRATKKDYTPTGRGKEQGVSRETRSTIICPDCFGTGRVVDEAGNWDRCTGCRRGRRSVEPESRVKAFCSWLASVVLGGILIYFFLVIRTLFH